jgi:hypothetical protein
MVHWMASGVCSGQGRTIPSLGAIKPIGRDHLDAQELIETVAILGFVTDDSCRRCLRNS